MSNIYILCTLIADTVFSDDEGMTKNSIRFTTFIACDFYVNIWYKPNTLILTPNRSS